MQRPSLKTACQGLLVERTNPRAHQQDYNTSQCRFASFSETSFSHKAPYGSLSSLGSLGPAGTYDIMGGPKRVDSLFPVGLLALARPRMGTWKPRGYLSHWYRSVVFNCYSFQTLADSISRGRGC
jgi:hypothetical protein